MEINVYVRNYTQLVFLIFAFILAGRHTYVAWFKPEQHKREIAAMGKSYRSWSPYTERWIASTFGYWFTRFVYLFAFSIATIALIREIMAHLFG